MKLKFPPYKPSDPKKLNRASPKTLAETLAARAEAAKIVDASLAERLQKLSRT